MSITKRLVAFTIVLALATAAIVGVLVYRSIAASVIPAELDRLRADARAGASILNEYVESARNDMVAISELPTVLGLVRATGAGGVDPANGVKREVWLAYVRDMFVAQLRNKPEYRKLRVIGVADSGREVLRVDRMGSDGRVQVVRDEDLQTKGDRPFFREAVALSAGQIYVSMLDLNQDNGIIETPYVPTIRVATPLRTADGSPFGILIANIDMRPAFERMKAQQEAGETLYLTNDRGDFLIHPDASREFGFDLGVRSNVHDDAPELADLLSRDREAAREIRSVPGIDLAASAPVTLAGGPRVVVFETMKSGAALAPSGVAVTTSVAAALVAAAIAAVLAWLLARSLTVPIVRVTSAIETFGQGGESPEVLVNDESEIGRLARAFASMRDEVRAKAEALNVAEERFRLSVEASPHGMVVADSDGLITMVNGAAERMFEYSRDELTGQPVQLLLPEREDGRHLDLSRDSLAVPAVAQRELYGRKKDGTEFPVEVGLNPFAARGRSLALATVVDITRRRQAEEADRESRRQFRALAEALPQLVWSCTPDGECDYMAPQWREYTGSSEREALGRGWAEWIHPDDVGPAYDAWQTVVVAGGSQFDAEYRLRRHDGTYRWFKTRGVALRDADGRALRWFGTNTDIDDLKQVEEVLARQADELKRSNAELEQFAYVASHDLQEPLRMVASYTEMLGDRYRGKLDEKADKYIGYAVEGARRMQRLVSDLLAFSRVGARGANLGRTDTNEVVERVLRNMRNTIVESGAEVEVGALPAVVADAGQLEQVFQNLVSNAIKFRNSRPPRVTIGATRDGDAWRFVVTDNGIGIDKEFAERIFQMFQRLHERGHYEGSGIGLAIVKKIVEHHGGRVWFESEPGRGSEFNFTLPITKSEGAE